MSKKGLKQSAYLSDIEKEAIQAFVGNDVMREAVKKVILDVIYNQGVLRPGEPADVTRNFTLWMVSQRGEYDNEKIGADLRAIWQGCNMLEASFDILKGFTKSPEDDKEKENPAV